MNPIDVYANVRSALRTRLLLIDEVAAISVHWDGMAFTPPSGTCWLRESLLWNTVSRRSLGAQDAYSRIDLLYQLDAVAPAGTGTEWLDQVTDAIRRAFDVGQRLTYNGQTVTVRSATLGPRIDDPPEWTRAPVRMDCYAYTLTETA